MSLCGELVARLRNTPSLTALVPSARIVQERRLQGTDAPAIAVELSDTESGHDLGGAAGIRDTYVNASVWARKIADRDAIAEEIRLALHGFSGTLTTIYVKGILIDDNSAFFEPDGTGAQNGWYRQVFRFQVMGDEAIPA